MSFTVINLYIVCIHVWEQRTIINTYIVYTHVWGQRTIINIYIVCTRMWGQRTIINVYIVCILMLEDNLWEAIFLRHTVQRSNTGRQALQVCHLLSSVTGRIHVLQVV